MNLKIKRLFFPLLPLLFLTNCSYPLIEKTPPNNLIPLDSFSLILYDVMILESYYKVMQNSENSSPEIPITEAIYPVFDKYNMDSTRFSTTMDYYASQQELMKEIYTKIQDSITLNTIAF